MATYTIRVLNSSGFTKSYVLFMQPPQVTSTGGQPVVYTNAWVTFGSIRPGSNDTVTYTDETYAYWATATLPIAPGTTMGQGGVAAVDTSKNDSVPFVGSGAIGFGTVAAGGAMSGSYRIIATNDFNASNGYLFGLARPGNVPGIPSPVATFLAEPNDTFNVTPVINFYVADGAYTAGQVIDYTVASTNAGAVSFTGRAQTSAVVTQNPDGSFTTQYF
ncbi:hypothetical protein [Bradyrhizobium sp. McL0616]|uniref:hypothetical protein n=1 Tax=Bradyrhizobium sp. McL0616 TaxID=3415674 RepID=UPI003CECE06C